MEEIKLKPEFEAKLRELGVYEKWVENYKNRKPEFGYDMEIEELNNSFSFRVFILSSFKWRDTPKDEGFDFWNNISKS